MSIKATVISVASSTKALWPFSKGCVVRSCKRQTTPCSHALWFTEKGKINHNTNCGCQWKLDHMFWKIWRKSVPLTVGLSASTCRKLCFQCAHKLTFCPAGSCLSLCTAWDSWQENAPTHAININMKPTPLISLKAFWKCILQMSQSPNLYLWAGAGTVIWICVVSPCFNMHFIWFLLKSFWSHTRDAGRVIR